MSNRNDCCNNHPKACSGCFAALGFPLFIAAIVMMSSDGDYCSNTSDEYYYECSDPDNEYLCNSYGCDQCLWLTKYGISDGGCADYNGNPMVIGVILLVLAIIFFAMGGIYYFFIWPKMKKTWKTPENENENNTPEEQQSLPKTTNDLPAGWVECATNDGRTYYQNDILKTTQWKRPVVHNTSNLPVIVNK